MRRKGPSYPVHAPAELLAIGVMFRSGMDTKDIAGHFRCREALIANSLEAARAAARWALRNVSPTEESPI